MSPPPLDQARYLLSGLHATDHVSLPDASRHRLNWLRLWKWSKSLGCSAGGQKGYSFSLINHVNHYFTTEFKISNTCWKWSHQTQAHDHNHLNTAYEWVLWSTSSENRNFLIFDLKLNVAWYMFSNAAIKKQNSTGPNAVRSGIPECKTPPCDDLTFIITFCVLHIF